jgi:hypothetical protein
MHGCNTSHHACVRLNGQMYVTPVRQKWANQVAQLAGKKRWRRGCFTLTLFQVSIIIKFISRRSTRKRVSAFLGRKIHMARWNLNWQLLSPLLQAYIYITWRPQGGLWRSSLLGGLQICIYRCCRVAHYVQTCVCTYISFSTCHMSMEILYMDMRSVTVSHRPLTRRMSKGSAKDGNRKGDNWAPCGMIGRMVENIGVSSHRSGCIGVNEAN